MQENILLSIDIDISFYRDLQSYMNGLGHSANYFGTVIKIIKQVMREAQIIDKLHNNNDFQHSTFKAITQEVDKIYLTTAELEKIHRTSIDEKFISEFYPRAYPSAAKNIIRSYNIVKNRFLIGAYTGLRMSDFNRIDRKNISDGMITVVTEKTDQRVVIPIHPIVKEILDSGFDLSISLSDAKTRLYIKDICKFVKIDDLVEVRESVSGKLVTNRYPKWQLVGTHTARAVIRNECLQSWSATDLHYENHRAHQRKHLYEIYPSIIGGECGDADGTSVF